jgi:hypothetical protein
MRRRFFSKDRRASQSERRTIFGRLSNDEGEDDEDCHRCIAVVMLADATRHLALRATASAVSAG